MFVQGYYITMTIFWINSTDCFSPILLLSAWHMHVSKAPITCLLFVLVNNVRSWRLISLCKREMIVLVCVRTEEKWAVCYRCIPVWWDQHSHTHIKPVSVWLMTLHEQNQPEPLITAETDDDIVLIISSIRQRKIIRTTERLRQLITAKIDESSPYENIISESS